MKQITCHFDFISPYAYLAFEELPRALQGVSHCVRYRPVLFAGLLKHHGQLGPAEIDGKRDWTYRQVLWLAHAHGIPMQMPASHPFNPLPLLRLAIACDAQGEPNRHVCETIFRHVWCSGLVAGDPLRIEQLMQALQPARDPADESVKAQLKAHTDDAIARGLFGVPTFEVDGKLFWGFDSLPMLRAYLQGDAWFDAQWDTARSVVVGAPRVNAAQR